MTTTHTPLTITHDDHHGLLLENNMTCPCGASNPLTAEEREALIAEMIATDGGR